jgi:hypothetical protein
MEGLCGAGDVARELQAAKPVAGFLVSDYIGDWKGKDRDDREGHEFTRANRIVIKSGFQPLRKAPTSTSAAKA